MSSNSRSLLALIVFTGLGAACQPPTDISNAEGDKGPGKNSSTGLGDLKPDAGAVQMDPPTNIKPWPDASAYPPDSSGPVKEEKCAAQSAAAKQVPIDLLLLIDRSGSMNSAVPGGRSKWELAQNALVTFVKDNKSAGLGVGIQYFPLVVPCASDADCGGGIFGLNACVESKACATNGMVATPPMACPTRGCPNGGTCVPLGRCSETGAVCTNLNAACPGASATDKCVAIPKTCREGITAQCQVPAYEKLAVPIGELPMAMSQLTLSLITTQAGGGTPTDPATEAALNQLRMRAMANPDRSPVLVLVTDGQPNSCSGMPIPLITQLIGDAKMGTPSIPTYVIGVFTAAEVMAMTAPQTLQMWTTAGGTGMPFILTDTADLSQKLLDALNAIRGAALPCEYMIPKPASGVLDYNKVNVHITGTSSGPMGLDLGYVGDVSKCDPVKGGWYYDVNPATGSPTRVIMCEATCKKFKMDATANIELRFGCQTVAIQ
jgi:hypothetical protein